MQTDFLLTARKQASAVVAVARAKETGCEKRP
jgi:hypothetical protein